MRVWLDDVRAAPPGWVRTYTVDQTLQFLRTGQVVELSLDYDLDATDGLRKGIEVIAWLERKMAEGRINPPVVHIHTINPGGGMAMCARLHRLEATYGPQPWRR